MCIRDSIRGVACKYGKYPHTHALKQRLDYPGVAIDIEFTDNAHVVRSGLLWFCCSNYFFKQSAVGYVMSQGLANTPETLAVECYDRYPDLLRSLFAYCFSVV